MTWCRKIFSPAGERQIFPKQTKRTLKGVLGMMRLCCRILCMLARIVLIMCVGIFLPNAGNVQANNKPDVFVVILDASEDTKAGLAQLFKENRDIGEKGGTAWSGQRGNCRFLPARAANVASVLYGVNPLELGFVCDLDWRRKPVMCESIADRYRKAGYHTAYFGEWGLGRAKAYDPLSRGFEQSYFSSTGVTSPLNRANASDSPTDPSSTGLSQEKLLQKTFNRLLVDPQPVFCMFRQGRYLSEHTITSLIKNRTGQERPIVVMVLRSKS